MPAPASTRDAERAQIENIAKARGMQPWETQALIEALASARRGMGNLQLQQERLRWQLRQNGVDPILMDLGAKLLQGDLRAAQAVPPTQLVNAARELTGPAPSNRTQLAGRSADFMGDQRADTFEYQQPDLNRPRPRSTPSAVPPMLDRNRAPFFVRRPDGSFEFDPTFGQPAPAEGFTGPEAPPITARRPPVIAPSMQLEQRDALYRELAEAIQGRIAPAPSNMAASMGDRYVLDQMIPALRERFADRPDVIWRLAEIEGYARGLFPEQVAPDAVPTPSGHKYQPSLYASDAQANGAAPGTMELDEFGNPTPLGGEGARWRRLPTRSTPRPVGQGAEWTAGGGDTWGPGGEPKKLPFQDNPQPYTPAPRSGPLKTPREAQFDRMRAEAASAPFEAAINAPDSTRAQRGALAQGMEAPDVGARVEDPPTPVRPVPLRPQESTANNGPGGSATPSVRAVGPERYRYSWVHPSQLPKNETPLGSGQRPPPRPPAPVAAPEFPASGRPGDWGAEWDLSSLEPSYQSSAPKPAAGARKPAPRGGNLGAAAFILGAGSFDEYGSQFSTLSNEQLRELLLIARGQYPAGGATSTR